MDAIVLAGNTDNPKDPLYQLAPEGNKAMLQVAGKPMIEWVLEALHASGQVDKILITNTSLREKLMPHPDYIFIENAGGIVSNAQAGAAYLLNELGRDRNAVTLSVSSDVPAVTADMINWLIGQTRSADADFYYGVIERSDMEAKFPTSRRTYLRLKDGSFCGSDINAFRVGMATHETELAQRLSESRKNVLRQAAMIGFDTLLLILVRAIGVEQLVTRVTKKLKFAAKALRCPYPEMGMDIDKPFQLDIVNEFMLKRQADR